MNTINTAVGYLVGLDLGDRQDYTALTVLRQHQVPTGRTTTQHIGFTLSEGNMYDSMPEMEYRYDLIYADRWRRRGYKVAPPIIDQLITHLSEETHRQRMEAHVLNQPELPVWVLVDHTGVGIAVLEDLRAAGLDCIGVTMTAGDSSRREGRDFYVGKGRLVSHLRVLVESRRLNIAEGLPLTPVMTAEFQNFRSKTKLSTGSVSFAAGESAEWREGAHDDLVLSAAMASWYGEDVNPVNSGFTMGQVIAAMMEGAR